MRYLPMRPPRPRPRAMRHEGFSSIARAVGVVPIHQEVIVFDEPTRGIDLAVGPVAALVAARARKRRQRAP